MKHLKKLEIWFTMLESQFLTKQVIEMMSQLKNHFIFHIEQIRKKRMMGLCAWFYVVGIRPFRRKTISLEFTCYPLGYTFKIFTMI